MCLPDYQDAETFKARVVALSERAVAGLNGAPKLLAFPETIGLPLLLTLGDFDRMKSAKTLTEASWRVLQRCWGEVCRASWTYRVFGADAFFLARALPAYAAYTAAFAEAARRTGATIVAGSAFLPDIDVEASGGVRIMDGRVQNVAYTFAPTGTLLGRTGKQHLTAGLESRLGLSRARPEARQVFHTPVGQVGVAVCLDGFYGSVLEHLDGLGAQVVVQPSANHAPWTRPWPPDPSLLEGEAWLALGLRRLLQDRLHLRYGVNPMMVGDVFDLKSRGRSSLVCNTRYLEAETEGYRGVLALAETDDQEEIVRAEVPQAGLTLYPNP